MYSLSIVLIFEKFFYKKYSIYNFIKIIYFYDGYNYLVVKRFNLLTALNRLV